MALCNIPAEALDEDGDVFPALPQGRNLNGCDADAIEEIASKAAGAHVGEQIAVARGHQPELNLAWAVAAEWIDLTALQDPQEVGLDLERHLPDLVEKEGPRVGRLDLPDHPGAPSPGESALYVAEQLARHGVSRQAPAVDGDEGPVPPRPVLVDRAGEELLAHSRLPLQEDGGVQAREHPRLVHRLPQERAPADDLAEMVGGLGAKPSRGDRGNGPPGSRALQS